MLKIVVTGPESSGKTTLASALAAALHTVWAPEFSRTYLAHLGRPYERKDLKTIRLGQAAWEAWYAQQLSHQTTFQPLVCDTDWTVVHIWEQYKFGSPDPQSPASRPQFSILNSQFLYLLCAPDIPWQPDPLREHPEERDVLFGMYETLLRGIGAQYIVVSGSVEQRLQAALAAVREMTGTEKSDAETP
jgi:nicotinamide riboside kinase